MEKVKTYAEMEVYIKATFKMIQLMEEVVLYMLMETFMKVIGLMEKQKDKEYIIT